MVDFKEVAKGIVFVSIIIAIVVPPMVALGRIRADAETRKVSNADFILEAWIPTSLGILGLFIFLYFQLSDLTAQQWLSPNLVFALVSLFFSINVLSLVLLRMRYATSPPSE